MLLITYSIYSVKRAPKLSPNLLLSGFCLPLAWIILALCLIFYVRLFRSVIVPNSCLVERKTFWPKTSREKREVNRFADQCRKREKCVSKNEKFFSMVLLPNILSTWFLTQTLNKYGKTFFWFYCKFSFRVVIANV